MKDRIPTYPGRVRLIPVDGQTNVFDLERADEPTEPGTPLSKANLLSDTTAALYGLGEDTTVDQVLSAVKPVALGGTGASTAEGARNNLDAASASDFGAFCENSILRDLNIMLNLSLGTSNIDSWADFLTALSLIDIEASSNYVAASPGIEVTNTQYGPGIGSTTTTYTQTFGTTTALMAGCPITAQASGRLGQVKLGLRKAGTPTDSVRCKIYDSSGVTLLAESTNERTPSSTAGFSTYAFYFKSFDVTEGETYLIAVERTGETLSDTSCFVLGLYNSGMAPYYLWYGSPDAWTTNTSRTPFLYFYIYTSPAEIVWSPVVCTEAPKYVAIVPLNSSPDEIELYASEDESTWVSVTPGEACPVQFSGTTLYIKCVLHGSVTLTSIAWGCY